MDRGHQRRRAKEKLDTLLLEVLNSGAKLQRAQMSPPNGCVGGNSAETLTSFQAF